MINIKPIKRYIRQIVAFIEQNIFHELRVKSRFILRFLNPIIQLIILIFIFGLIFDIKKGFSLGYWDSSNYLLFLLLAFCIQFSKSIINRFNQVFGQEKYMKTLSAIMIAPVHRFTLLIGILVSEIVMNSIPVVILIIIAYILYPISIIYIFLVLLLFFSIFLIFGSIGLLIGVFQISFEEFVPYSHLTLRILFLFSCINYPKELFPSIIQNIIILNPFYYIFDTLRLVWLLGIDYDKAIVLITPIHISMIILLTILSPIISIVIFERVYKKFGITGY